MVLTAGAWPLAQNSPSDFRVPVEVSINRKHLVDESIFIVNMSSVIRMTVYSSVSFYHLNDLISLVMNELVQGNLHGIRAFPHSVHYLQ